MLRKPVGRESVGQVYDRHQKRCHAAVPQQGRKALLDLGVEPDARQARGAAADFEPLGQKHVDEIAVPLQRQERLDRNVGENGEDAPRSSIAPRGNGRQGIGSRLDAGRGRRRIPRKLIASSRRCRGLQHLGRKGPRHWQMLLHSNGTAFNPRIF